MLMAVAFLVAVSSLGLWWRVHARDAALDRRLRQVAAVLVGKRVEDRPADVKVPIFRSTRAKSLLRERLEQRFCMLEFDAAFPRAVAVGFTAAVLVAMAVNVLRFGPLASSLAVPAAGALGAWVFLNLWDARVRAEFVKQFPEIADHIVRLARAGLPAVEAVSAVASESPEPARRVLQRVSNDLSSGLDPETVLHDAAAHIRIAEFTLFAAALALQRTTGGSIAVTLGNLAATVRARLEVDAKAYASTAQTRMTLWVLAAVPVVVLVGQSYTSPETLELLLETESGVTLLRWGLGLIVGGLLVARGIASRFSR